MAGRNLLFVGSIPLSTTRNVFEALAATVGDRAKRYPDGETNGRERFISWQEKVLLGNPQIELAVDSGTDLGTGGDGGNYRRGAYRLCPKVQDSEISFGSLGYAEAALTSYEEFKYQKERAIIPASVRFQVSLPTPVAFVSAFLVRGDRLKAEPSYEASMTRELEEIVSRVPANQLSIQWDMPYEILGHDGARELYYDNDLAESSTRVARISRPLPKSVELGIHLCYGDAGHKHMIEPKSLGTCVTMANMLTKLVHHPLAWIHMPVPRGRDDDAYFEPLRNLRLHDQTELYLGLIHHSDGIEGAARRIAAAARHACQFGIATECGFGRRAPDTIPGLLNLHVAASNVA